MSEVAKAAGLSRPTVSMALSNKGTISAETRRRVLEAAERLGFRPHAAAKAVVTGRSGMIGLLMSRVSYRSNLPSSLLSGIEDALMEAEQHLVVARIDDEEIANGDMPRILREVTCDGFLVNYNVGMPEALGKLIQGARTPAVWINNSETENSVCPDDVGAAREAVERLVEAGHRRIVYIDTLIHQHTRKCEVHASHHDRLAGYRIGVGAAGLPQIELFDDPTLPLNAYGPIFADVVDRLRVLLRQPEPVTAAIIYGSEESLVYEAAAREGLHLPRDLSLIVFGEQRSRRESCMLLPSREIGQAAVETLLARLDGKPANGSTRMLPCVFERNWTFGPRTR